MLECLKVYVGLVFRSIKFPVGWGSLEIGISRGLLIISHQIHFRREERKIKSISMLLRSCAVAEVGAQVYPYVPGAARFPAAVTVPAGGAQGA